MYRVTFVAQPLGFQENLAHALCPEALVFFGFDQVVADFDGGVRQSALLAMHRDGIV